MLKINEAIVVEGTYDKIKLDSVVDATVVITDGFMIFKDRQRCELIKKLADKKGVIIFTDSDAAGFKIRNYLKNILRGKNVKHAYIPDIKGKEKRKEKPSKEGFLGVEGISNEVIEKALKDANATFDVQNGSTCKKNVTKADLYKDGFSGLKDSFERRVALARYLNLPKRISANMLLEVINTLYGYDEYRKIVNKIKSKL